MMTRYPLPTWSRVLLLAAILPGCSNGPATPSEPEGTYHSEHGRYSIVLPGGEPITDRIEMPGPQGKGKLILRLVQSIDVKTGLAYSVIYADYPAPPDDPQSFFQTVIKGTAEAGKWKIQEMQPVHLGPNPGRHLTFLTDLPEVGTAHGESRIYLVGRRYYQIMALGPEQALQAPPVQTFLSSFTLVDLPNASPVVSASPPSTPTPSKPSPPPVVPAGSPPAIPPRDTPSAPPPVPVPPSPPDPAPRPGHPVEPLAEGLVEFPDPFWARRDPGYFRVAAPPGGVLAGLRVVVARDGKAEHIGGLQPVYRVGDQLVDGPRIGDHGPVTTTIIAPDGYAVGFLDNRADFSVVHGLRLVFHRVLDDRLDPSDASESPWVGALGGRQYTHHSDGRPVVGIYGRASTNAIIGVGFVIREEPSSKSTEPKRP